MPSSFFPGDKAFAKSGFREVSEEMEPGFIAGGSVSTSPKNIGFLATRGAFLSPAPRPSYLGSFRIHKTKKIPLLWREGYGEGYYTIGIM